MSEVYFMTIKPSVITYYSNENTQRYKLQHIGYSGNISH